MAPPRVGFKKSRRGCKRCKQRRVKCDEQTPCCGPCRKRRLECSFMSPTLVGSSELPLDPGLPLSTEEWVFDLECMHHYSTGLYYLAAREEVVHIWRDYIPVQACKHSFLMHGLLAYAALHLAYLKPHRSTTYLRLCDKHQTIALQTFRSILTSSVDEFDPDLGDAMFALSIALSLSSMARACAVSHTTTMDIDCITELFVLTKGIQNVLRLSHTHIRQGPMAVLLEHQAPPEEVDVQLPPDISTRLESIQEMLLASGLDQQALQHCQSALAELVVIYKNIAHFAPKADIETGLASRWQVVVPMGYVKLIESRSPPALIILAYYAAAITSIRLAWYTQNWAEYALRGIGEALDDDLQHWLIWPIQQVQEKMSELGVRAPR